jgi:hypothetical protein
MNMLLCLLIANAGVSSLLMPVSPTGVITAFSASSGGEAVFYNPAHLVASDDFRLTCYYNHLYVGMKSISLALCRRFNDRDFGLSITNFDYGDMEQHPYYPSDDSMAYYSANDFSLGISGSTRISSKGRVGLTVRYIAENIYVYGDNALAFDGALAYEGTGFDLGFGATNIGYKLTINNEDVNLPAKLSMGGSVNVKKAVACFDVHYLINSGSFEFGHAWRIPVVSAMECRVGINYRQRFYPGFGVVVTAGTFTVEYGAALYPYNLGLVNTVGVGLSF